MKSFQFYIILTIFLCTNCNTENESIIIYDEAKKLNDRTNATDLIESYDFLLLDSIPGFFIGGISKVVLDDDICFVKENQFNNGIFLFNKDGKYISHILPAHEGLNPLRSIQDFVINKESNRLFILDGHSDAVFELNYDLDILNKFQLSFSAYAMESINNLWIFATADADENIIITDTAGKIVSKHFTDNKLSRVRQLQPFYKSNDRILYNHWEDDQIYAIDNSGKVSNYYTIKITEASQKKSHIVSFAETNNNLVIVCQLPETGKSIIIYNYKKKRAVQFDKINNNITHSRSFIAPIVGNNKDHSITYLPSEYLLNETVNLATETINKRFFEVLRQVHSKSNPLLVFNKPLD